MPESMLTWLMPEKYAAIGEGSGAEIEVDRVGVPGPTMLPSMVPPKTLNTSAFAESLMLPLILPVDSLIVTALVAKERRSRRPRP